MSLELKLTYPEYLDSFSCVGPACTDSCCVSWVIGVDKKTYFKYKNNHGTDELHKKLRTLVRKRKQFSSKQDYAKIELDKDRRCSFLDTDDLCTIQKAMGHDALCGTCITYPRNYYSIKGKNYLSAVFSCPEVAKIALLDQNDFKLITKNKEVNEKSPINYYKLSKMDNNYLVYDNFEKIQNISLSIMKNRDLTLEKRLMLLGILVDKISKVSLSHPENVNKIIEELSNEDTIKLYSDQFANIKSRHFIQLKTIFEITSSAMEYETDQNQYEQYVRRAVDAILKGAKSDEQALDHYIVDGLRQYGRFFQDKEYIIENYLINSMISKAFPASIKGDGFDIFLNYLKIIVDFVILRTILAGLLIEEGELEIDDLLNLIQKHSKKLSHNLYIVNNIIDNLKEENMYSLAGALVLINTVN